MGDQCASHVIGFCFHSRRCMPKITAKLFHTCLECSTSIDSVAMNGMCIVKSMIKKIGSTETKRAISPKMDFKMPMCSAHNQSEIL